MTVSPLPMSDSVEATFGTQCAIAATCPGTTPCFGAMGKHGLGSERKDWEFYEH